MKMERIRAWVEGGRAFLAEMQARFQGLTTRERRLVLMTGSAISLFVVFLILISFSATAAGYRRRTEEKLIKLREVQALASSYRESEQDRQQTERQLTGKISLISYLEEKGTAAGVSIPAMNPKPDVPIGDGRIVESSVELRLSDVSIDKLVQFLSSVERGPGVVKVKYLRVEPRVQQQTLTAWTIIATYYMKP
jgi:general secretion pathway protein M